MADFVNETFSVYFSAVTLFADWIKIQDTETPLLTV
jgi:hypothetical protein